MEVIKDMVNGLLVFSSKMLHVIFATYETRKKRPTLNQQLFLNIYHYLCRYYVWFDLGIIVQMTTFLRIL